MTTAKTYTMNDNVIDITGTATSIQLTDTGMKLWGISKLSRQTFAEAQGNPQQWEKLDKAMTEVFVALADAKAYASECTLKKQRQEKLSKEDNETMRKYRQDAARAVRDFANIVGSRYIGATACKNALIVEESNIDFLYDDLHGQKKGKNCNYTVYIARFWDSMKYLLSGGTWETIEEHKAAQAESDTENGAAPTEPESIEEMLCKPDFDLGKLSKKELIRMLKTTRNICMESHDAGLDAVRKAVGLKPVKVKAIK